MRSLFEPDVRRITTVLAAIALKGTTALAQTAPPTSTADAPPPATVDSPAATAPANTVDAPPAATTAGPPPAVPPAPQGAPATQGTDEAPRSPARLRARLGSGATIETDDDRFSLTLRARLQLRFTLASEPSGATDPGPLTEFQARRIRLLFQGHMFSPDWQYYLQLGFSNGDTEPDLRLPLRDAYITWRGVRDLNIRFGQMKVPYGRQRVVSSSSLQMVDRSIVTQELNLDRDVGIQLLSNDLFGLGKRLSYNLGLFSGDGRNRLARSFGFLYVARLQFAPLGDFDDLVEADVERRMRPRFAVAIGGAFNHNTNRHRSTFEDTYELGTFDYAHLGADALFKGYGLSLSGEAFYRQTVGDRSRTGMVDGQSITEWSRPGWGYFFQGGYLFTKQFEVSARWGQLFPLGASDPDLRQRNELGAGLSWYFQEHALKIQTDYFYLFDNGFTDTRHQWRVQAQLYF